MQANKRYFETSARTGARKSCALLLMVFMAGCSSGGSESQNITSENSDLIVASSDTETVQVDDSAPPVDDQSLVDSDESGVVNNDSIVDQAVPSVDVSNDQAESVSAVEQADDLVIADNEQTPQPLINSDNYNELIVQAFEVFSGRAFDARLNDSEYAKSIDPIVCSSGNVDDSRGNERIYNNCVLGGEMLNGSLVRNLVFDSSNLIFTDFSSTQDDDFQMHVDGQYNRKCCVESPEFHTVNLDYAFTFSAGRLVISDSSTYKFANAEARLMGGSFSMQPPSLNRSTVNVTTQFEFSAPLDRPLSYETGALVISADDGSSVRVNANNGDSATVNVTVSNSELTFDVVEPWEQYEEAIGWSQPVEVQVLHKSAGNVLSLLAGNGLDLMTIEAVGSIEKAVVSSSSQQVGDITETVDDSNSVVSIVTVLQETNYQCANGGSLDIVESNFSSVESDGFFNLSETSEKTTFRMSNCSFVNPVSAGNVITLNGQYIEEDIRRTGRNQQHTGRTLSFESLSIISEREVEGTVRYFADAQIATSSHNNNGETGDFRLVTIEEYEKIDTNGRFDSVEAAEFSQGRTNNTFNGRETFTMNVFGRYSGRHSDYYRIHVDTLDDFNVTRRLFTDAPTVDSEIAPNGHFTMSSENGDSLDIVVQPSPLESDSYYLANFNSILAEGNTVSLNNEPFYRYRLDWSRFAL